MYRESPYSLLDRDYGPILHAVDLIKISDKGYFDVADLIRILRDHETTALKALAQGMRACDLYEKQYADSPGKDFYYWMLTRRLMYRERVYDEDEWVGTISAKGILAELDGDTIYVGYTMYH